MANFNSLREEQNKNKIETCWNLLVRQDTFWYFLALLNAIFCDESKCLGSVMRPLSNTHLASAGWTLFRREQKRERRGGVEKNYQRKEIKKNWLGWSLFSLKKKTNQMLNWIFFGREENKAAQEWFPNYTFGGAKVQLREITRFYRSFARKIFWNKECRSKNICLNICVDLGVWGMVREEMGRSVPFRIGRSGERLSCNAADLPESLFPIGANPTFPQISL